MRFIKKLITSVVLAILVSLPVFAQETTLPDLYIEDFDFYECSQYIMDSQLERYHGGVEVINIAEDGTYFDIRKINTDDDSTTTPTIYRTFCYIYQIGNKGTATAKSTFGETDEYIYDRFYITDPEWSFTQGYGSNFIDLFLDPGEFDIKTGYTEIDLASTIVPLKPCFGIEIDADMPNICADPENCNVTAGIEELDETNNKALLCFDIEEYIIPATPQNVTATRAEGNILELKWDEIQNVDHYELYGIDVAPNIDFDKVYIQPASVTGTTAVFELPEDHLYYIQVYAVRDDIRGPSSENFYYNKAIYRFNDVPVSSWYFPYLQFIQAYGIMNGYQDENGNLTGEFGPENNLTVAECLKIAFIAFKSQIDENIDAQALPAEYSELNSHWAAEYLNKGYAMNLTILQDLENFDPNREITRGEILEMFFEVIGKDIPEYDSYTANDIVDSKYADIIEYAYEEGYVSGYPDGSFRPDSLLNRAEILKIVGKFKGKYYW